MLTIQNSKSLPKCFLNWKKREQPNLPFSLLNVIINYNSHIKVFFNLIDKVIKVDSIGFYYFAKKLKIKVGSLHFIFDFLSFILIGYSILVINTI